MKRVLRRVPVILIVSGLAALLIRYSLNHGTFYYAGTLEATKVDISARLASNLESVNVQEGDKVKADELLIVLGCDDVKVLARLAQENYTRYVKLSRSGTSTPETLDLMRNRKEDADVRLTWCRLSSPLQGTVLSRYHEPGEWVLPGTKILTLANVRNLWAYIYVPQTRVAKLALGMKLKAYLPELNRRLFEGTIIKFNEQAEFTPKNVQTREERERLVFGVKISFNEANAEEILKPGMTVEVELPE